MGFAFPVTSRANRAALLKLIEPLNMVSPSVDVTSRANRAALLKLTGYGRF